MSLQGTVDGLEVGTVALGLHLQFGGLGLFVVGVGVRGGGLRGLGARPVQRVLTAVQVTVVLV